MIYFIIIYALSFMFAYRYIQLAYSKTGIFSHADIDVFYVIFMILPFLNFTMLFLWLTDYPEYNKKVINLDKFFRIKR